MVVLEAALDGLSCGIIVHDGECGVVGTNSAALRMLGLTLDQLSGAAPPPPGWRALEETSAGELNVPRPLAGLARGSPRRFLVRVTAREEAPPAWIRGESRPVTDGAGEPRVVSTLVELGEEREQLATVLALAERRLARLQALRNAAIAINGSHDLRLTLNVIVQQAAVHLRVSAAAIALLDESADMLVYSGGTGFRHSGITRTRLALGEGYLGRTGLELRPLCIPDLPGASDFLRGKLLEGEDFVAYFAVPLVTRGRLVGVLELFNRGPLDQEAEWLEFVETLAEHAACAIDGARMREQLRSSGSAGSRWERPRMTHPQEAILRLLARGHTNRDIAKRIFLSENTVKFHLRQIYRKLGVHSRAEAVMAATSRGWL